ncbi:MAG: hypothetical protein OEY77_00005 [Nitrospira sp.]|nr:hypothetical protein [Nitrospira sp.]
MHTTLYKSRAEALAGEFETSWGYYPDKHIWIVADSISLRLMGCIEGPLAVLDFIARERGE